MKVHAWVPSLHLSAVGDAPTIAEAGGLAASAILAAWSSLDRRSAPPREQETLRITFTVLETSAPRRREDPDPATLERERNGLPPVHELVHHRLIRASTDPADTSSIRERAK